MAEPQRGTRRRGLQDARRQRCVDVLVGRGPGDCAQQAPGWLGGQSRGLNHGQRLIAKPFQATAKRGSHARHIRDRPVLLALGNRLAGHLQRGIRVARRQGDHLPQHPGRPLAREAGKDELRHSSVVKAGDVNADRAGAKLMVKHPREAAITRIAGTNADQPMDRGVGQSHGGDFQQPPRVRVKPLLVINRDEQACGGQAPQQQDYRPLHEDVRDRPFQWFLAEGRPEDMGQRDWHGRDFGICDRVEEVSDVGQPGTRPRHTSGPQDDATTGQCRRGGSPQARLSNARRSGDDRCHGGTLAA